MEGKVERERGGQGGGTEGRAKGGEGAGKREKRGERREKTAEGGKGREGGRRREGGTARVRREEIHMMTSIMAYRNTALLPCCSGIQ